MASPVPPGVPAPLAGWIARFGRLDDRPVEPGEAADAALRALREALARPGRDREGAYALLAADALLTDAARGLMEAADPEGVLTELMDRIAAEGAE